MDRETHIGRPVWQKHKTLNVRCLKAREGYLKKLMTITSSRNLEATANKACCGHGINQSMLVLLTNPGKFRHLVFSVSPTGDIAKTTCKLLAHLVTKYCHTVSRLGPIPAFWASGLIYYEEREANKK